MRLLHPDVRELAVDELHDLYDEPGPFLRAGFASSVDGAVSANGRSGGLSNPADKAVFRALRAVCDAIVVGAGTLRTEDYGPVLLAPEAKAWREAHGRAPDIPIVAVSRTGDLGSGRVLQGPVLLASPDGPPGVELLPTDPHDMVAALHDRGLKRLLCEGGPHLLTTLLEAGLVDELCLTTSPLLLGERPHLLGDLASPVAVQLRSLVHDDPGVLLARWTVVRSRGD